VRLCAYNRERKREKGIQVFSLLLVGPSRLFWEPVINYTNKLMIQKLKNKLSNENLIDTTFQNTSDNNSTNSNKHIQMQLNNENSERVLPAKLLTSTLHFLSPSWNFYCPTFNIALSIYSLLFRGNYQLLDCHKKLIIPQFLSYIIFTIKNPTSTVILKLQFNRQTKH